MFEARYMVEWGDCDEAGIVFYPNFFYWLDCTFQRFLRSHGLSQRDLRSRFGAVTPIVEAHSEFRAPVRYDGELVVEATVRAETARRLRVDYRLTSDGALVSTAYEIRACGSCRTGRHDQGCSHRSCIPRAVRSVMTAG